MGKGRGKYEAQQEKQRSAPLILAGAPASTASAILEFQHYTLSREISTGIVMLATILGAWSYNANCHLQGF